MESTCRRRIERALPLWHGGLGLIGKPDAVELLPAGRHDSVGYKQGSRAKAPGIAACDDLELAAQTVCLEAMTGHSVPEAPSSDAIRDRTDKEANPTPSRD